MKGDYREYKIGEVYMMEFSGEGNEQRGLRPGVIFQNNTGNKFSPNVVALPMTSALKKTNMPTHVVVPKEVGLRVDSMVLCENPTSMSKDRIGRAICTLPDIYMEEIAIASILASSAISYISQERLLSVWERASVLNGGVA